MWCIEWTPPSRFLENDKFRGPFLRIDQKHIHYIHLIHQLVAKPRAMRDSARVALLGEALGIASRHPLQDERSTGCKNPPQCRSSPRLRGMLATEAAQSSPLDEP